MGTHLRPETITKSKLPVEHDSRHLIRYSYTCSIARHIPDNVLHAGGVKIKVQKAEPENNLNDNLTHSHVEH